TASGTAHASSTASRSSARKWASPSLAKICAMVRRAAVSTSPSVSKNGHPNRRARSRPTSVFPVAMNPVRMRFATARTVSPARHAALGAAGVVRPAHEAVRDLVEVDLVVHHRAGAPSGLEAEAHFHALRGLHAHERVREPAVELPVPLRMAAESGRQARDHRL